MPENDKKTSGCSSATETGTSPFGNRLRKLREGKGLSRAQLAHSLGVAISSVQNYEEGRLPRGDVLIKISLEFDCSIDWLLLGKTKKQLEIPFDEQRFIDSCLSVERAVVFTPIKIEKKVDITLAVYKLFTLANLDVNYKTVEEFVKAALQE